MSEDRKLRQGDIGPDGRVFWGYEKNRKNGERWISREKFNERKSALKLIHKTSEYKNARNRRESAENYKELKRRRNATPKYKSLRKAYQQRPEYKESARTRRQSDDYKLRSRLYRKTEKSKSLQRARNLKRSFAKRDGSSLAAFLNSTRALPITISAIMDLLIPEGKTLAEYIHDLSGYEMSVCEEIANICKGEFPDA